MGILTDHLLVVSCSATITYLCWLCHSPLPNKEDYFVCLFAVAFLPVTVCVLSLSLSFSLSLMACTYWFQLILTSFGWHVIPTGHFPQKSLSKNPKIGFFPFPTARPCSLLPLTHDPPPPILAGYKLVVPRSCACFTFFACCSCIYHDLEIGLYVLPCIFGFLWRGLFSDLPFFMNYFFLGWPCRIMGLSSPGLLCIHSVALLAFPTIPLCYSCCNVI